MGLDFAKHLKITQVGDEFAIVIANPVWRVYNKNGVCWIKNKMEKLRRKICFTLAI